MEDGSEITKRQFFPKLDDPESTATVLPHFVIKREQIRSSTVNIELYANKMLKEESTFGITQRKILH